MPPLRTPEPTIATIGSVPALAEFRTMLLDHLGIVMEVEDLRKVWRALDDDSSGVCSFLEFCIAFFPHLEVRSHG